jgi:putative hemin transport protein
METIETLKSEYSKLKNEQPQLRIRDAANQLNTTEAQLVAASIGDSVIRLRPEFDAILAEIESFGKVMALSRNNEVVHERKGVYQNFSTSPHAWLFVGADIDLRIFPACWEFAFAVREGAEDKPRYSIQFFANDGSAVHKIYMENSSDLSKYHELVEKYRDQDQEDILSVKEPIALESEELPDDQIDVVGFRKGWVDLQDTHEFFGLLKKYKVTRTQGTATCSF